MPSWTPSGEKNPLERSLERPGSFPVPLSFSSFEDGENGSEGTGADGGAVSRLTSERREIQRTCTELQSKCDEWLHRLDSLLKEGHRHVEYMSYTSTSNEEQRRAEQQLPGRPRGVSGCSQESPQMLPETPRARQYQSTLSAWTPFAADAAAKVPGRVKTSSGTIQGMSSSESASRSPSRGKSGMMQTESGMMQKEPSTWSNFMVSPARTPSALFGRVASLPWPKPLRGSFTSEWHFQRRTGSDAVLDDISRGRVPWLPGVKEQALAVRQARTRTLYRLVQSLPFQAVSVLLLLANAVFVGASADRELELQGAGLASDPRWLHGSIFFTTAFAIELTLRFTAGPWLWVFGPDRSWNLMEALLIVHALVCIVAQDYISSLPVRLLRTARLMDSLANIKGFRHLRMIMLGIKASIRWLTWVLLIVVCIIYAFAVFFVWGVAQYFYRDDLAGGAFPELFDGVARSAVTLFMCISGGIDWRDVMHELEVVPRMFHVVFIAYVCIMYFAVINVVIGAMVAAVADIAKNDKESMVTAETTKEDRLHQKIWALFHEADIDNSGTISWANFQEHLRNDDVKAYFHALELDIPQAEQLFNMLDVDRTGAIDLVEFVSACMHTMNQAKSLDIKLLMYQHDLSVKWLKQALESIQSNLGALDTKVAPQPQSYRRRTKEQDAPMPLTPGGQLLSVLPIQE